MKKESLKEIIKAFIDGNDKFDKHKIVQEYKNHYTIEQTVQKYNDLYLRVTKKQHHL